MLTICLLTGTVSAYGSHAPLTRKVLDERLKQEFHRVQELEGLYMSYDTMDSPLGRVFNETNDLRRIAYFSESPSNSTNIFDRYHRETALIHIFVFIVAFAVATTGFTAYQLNLERPPTQVKVGELNIVDPLGTTDYSIMVEDRNGKRLASPQCFYVEVEKGASMKCSYGLSHDTTIRPLGNEVLFNIVFKRDVIGGKMTVVGMMGDFSHVTPVDELGGDSEIKFKGFQAISFDTCDTNRKCGERRWRKGDRVRIRAVQTREVMAKEVVMLKLLEIIKEPIQLIEMFRKLRKEKDQAESGRRLNMHLQRGHTRAGIAHTASGTLYVRIYAVHGTFHSVLTRGFGDGRLEKISDKYYFLVVPAGSIEATTFTLDIVTNERRSVVRVAMDHDGSGSGIAGIVSIQPLTGSGVSVPGADRYMDGTYAWSVDDDKSKSKTIFINQHE